MNSSEKGVASVFIPSVDIPQLEEVLNEKEKARLFELFAELAKAAFGDHFQTKVEFPQFIAAYRQWVKANHQAWLTADKQGQLNANIQDAVPFVWPNELEPMSRQAAEKKLNQHRTWWAKQLKGEADQSTVVSDSQSLLEDEFSPQSTSLPSTETEKGDPTSAIEKFVMEKVENPETIFLEAQAFFQRYTDAVWPLVYPDDQLALTPIDYWEEVFFDNERTSQLELWKKMIGEDKTTAQVFFNSLRQRAGRAIIKKELAIEGEKVAAHRLGRELEWWIWYHLNRDDAEVNKMMEPFEEKAVQKNVDDSEQWREEQMEKLGDLNLGEHVLVKLEKYHSQELELSDGASVKVGEDVAIFHRMRHLSSLENLGEIEAARKLLTDLESSFFEFAVLLVEDPEKYQNIQAIVMTSHFTSRKFSEWGFDEFEVTDVKERAALADTGTSYFMARNPNADQDQVFQRKFDRVRKYAISRQKFLEKFGKKVTTPEEAAA